MKFVALHDALDEGIATLYLDGVLLGRVEGKHKAERLVKVLQRELQAVGRQITSIHQSIRPPTLPPAPLAICKERNVARTTEGRFIFRYAGDGFGVVITTEGPVEGRWSRR